MKIERVDDRTLKCFISNDELEEYEIGYKDFVIRTDKAKEVVREIMQTATEQVGYVPPKCSFDVQIKSIPDEGLLLTFEDKGLENTIDTQTLIDALQEIRNHLANASKRIEKYEEKSSKRTTEGTAPVENKEDEDLEIPEAVVFTFNALRDVIDFATALPSNLRIESALYEAKGTYYLVISKGTSSEVRYSRTLVQALEFSSKFNAEVNGETFLREHANCLIASKALKKLKPMK